MTRSVVPIANLHRRLPEAGRLRTGVQARTRSGKTAPKAITTWRMTSHDEEAIRQVAEIYGGTPQPWEGAPTAGQWEVITEAAELSVVLPPDPLGGTPIYEQWSGGGCQRRCDGITCQTPTKGPDGTELVDVPCMCAGNGEMVCNPHTRLSVILPDVRFGGTWRYESATSWNVAQELPGMVELIQSLQDRGLTRALLAIEHRKSVHAGQTKKFTIPVLRVPQSLDQIVAGAARVTALPSAEVPQIESGAGSAPALPMPEDATPSTGTPPPTGSDDEIVDAELLDDEPAYDLDAFKAMLANVDVTPAAALKKARALAEGLQLEQPLSLDALVPGPVLDALCAWLRGQAQ